VRELTAVIMALVVLTDPVPGAAMQSILRRSIYVMIPFSMLLIKYYPAFGAQYGRWSGQLMWIGVTMQKNGLGRLCLVSAFFIIWTLIRRRQGRDIPSGKYQTVMEVVLLAVTLWLLKGPGVQAYSATGVVALCSGIVTFLGLMWSRRFGINPKRIIQPAAAVLIIYGAATPMIYGGFLAGGVTSALGRDASFTGRTEIWAGLLPIVESHPILGAGFGGFWTRDNIRAHEITEAHNGYLDIMLDLGVMGLILISIFYLHICRQALSGLEIDFDWAALTICMVIMTIIHNFTESSINTLTSQLSALVMFLAVSFPAALKKVS
jgi:O-antigen ligase